MKIAIASGKGGTGKTSLALALFMANQERCVLVDCDVEEPNCHLFLPWQRQPQIPVTRPIPQFIAENCQSCSQCVEACQFNALAQAGPQNILVFAELCHSCGGCFLACPHQAIQEVQTEIGTIEHLISTQGEECIMGTLGVGHSSAPSVIQTTLQHVPRKAQAFTLIDSPPGTACTFVAAVEKADFVLLVTEATPFGLHDLQLAIQALQDLKKDFAIIVNRMQKPDNIIQQFCTQHGHKLWLQIPESRQIAEAYSQGNHLLKAQPQYTQPLRNLLDRCAQQINPTGHHVSS